MREKFVRESSLSDPVSRHLRARGVTFLLEELQFYEYKIDIYGYSRAAQETYAVELKLTKWRRALEQALVYQLCSDYVYLALPASSILPVDVDLLSRHDVGLISVGTDRSCATILEARKSKAVRENYRDFYIDLAQGEHHGSLST